MQRDQPIEMDIYQGDQNSILENEYLGTFSFPPPQGKRKEQKLEMRFDLSEECLLTVQARDFETGETTLAKMVTVDTPKSLQQSMAQAVQNSSDRKSGWFQSFANKILKK